MLLTFLKLYLGRIRLRSPETGTFQFFRKVILLDKMTREIVSIFIVIAVAKLFHQLCGSVAQVQRHWKIAGLVYIGKSHVNSKISTVAL